MNWGRVELDWSDRPVLIVGTGPSLHGVDLSRLNGLGYVLAVKEAVWDLPFADACFGLDLPWMRRQGDRLEELARRMPVYLAVPDQHPPVHRYSPSAVYLQRVRGDTSLSEDPGTVESGGNSGFGAFNLAYLAHSREIFLFGYDYGGEPYCPDRYSHHPRGHNARYLPRWAENFRYAVRQLAAAGVTVINTSSRSSVDAFPKSDLEQALVYLDRVRQARSAPLGLRGDMLVSAS